MTGRLALARGWATLRALVQLAALAAHLRAYAAQDSAARYPEEGARRRGRVSLRPLQGWVPPWCRHGGSHSKHSRLLCHVLQWRLSWILKRQSLDGTGWGSMASSFAAGAAAATAPLRPTRAPGAL